MKRTNKIALSIAAVAALVLTGCEADSAEVVSENMSKDADNFKVDRRVVFFNGITDTYLLTIEGKCAIVDEGTQLEVTCKIGDDAFKKHFLGLSDNVSYFIEQTEATDVSEFHYKVVFRPEVILPDIDIATSIN